MEFTKENYLKDYVRLADNQYFTARLAGYTEAELYLKNNKWYAANHADIITKGSELPPLPKQLAFLKSKGIELEGEENTYDIARHLIICVIKDEGTDTRFIELEAKKSAHNKRTRSPKRAQAAPEKGAVSQITPTRAEDGQLAPSPAETVNPESEVRTVSDDIDAVLAHYNAQFLARYGTKPSGPVPQTVRALIKRRLETQTVDELNRTVSAYVWIFDHAHYPVEITRLFSEHPKLQFIYDNCRTQGQTENLVMHQKAVSSGQSFAQVEKAVRRGDVWMERPRERLVELDRLYNRIGASGVAMDELEKQFPESVRFSECSLETIDAMNEYLTTRS